MTSPTSPANAGAQNETVRDSLSPGAQLSAAALGPGFRRGGGVRGAPALLAYATGIAVLILDQLSKFWILDGIHLRERGPLAVVPPLFNLTFVWNEGFSFGLLRGVPIARWGLTLFSAVVVVAIAVWARRAERWLTALWMGLIMGGAAGNNLIDRVRFGAVVDFLDFSGLHFPWVFNVADSAITIGVCLMLLDSLLQPKAAATA